MGKGSNTTTTQQQQTYNPTGGPQIQSALTQAQNAAQLPFNIPQAPVAGFSQDQQSAFGNINNAQGMAQPYINQAQQYFSPQGAQSFMNPYAANVMAGMKDVFGQQASQNTGQLTQAAGGVGADRIAVGQGQLAHQQDLAAGQTLAGMYGQSVQQAQSAGYGTAALGSQAQNAALSGAQAQLASGGLQQQLQQAQMNSPYQQQLAQAAFPYQQAQFLAGITGSLAPGLGGTTSGTGSTTGPAPSMLSQILGLGTAAAGAAGGSGAFGSSGSMNPKGSSPSYGGGNFWSGDAYGGSASNPAAGLSAGDYGATGGRVAYAEGGAPEPSPFDLPPGFNDKPINVAEKSIIPTVQTPAIQAHIPQLNLNPPAQSAGSSGPGVADIAKLAMMFVNRGGRVNPYAEGGSVTDAMRAEGRNRLRTQMDYDRGQGGKWQDAAGADALRIGRLARGYADGGTPMEDAQWPVGPIGGPSDVINPDEPYRMPDEQAVKDWRQGADASMADGTTATPVSYKPAFPPPSGSHGRSVGAPVIETPTDAPQDVSARSRTPAAPSEGGSSRDSGFAGSPWAALMAAGLGIAGGTSPFPMVNIGQGGMQGLKMLETQRAASQKDETIDQATRRLDLEAKHHEDQFTRMTPYQQETLAAHKSQTALAENKPIKVGIDSMGHDILGVRDKDTGAYVDPITRKPVVDPNATTPHYNIPPGTNEADAALPPHARLTEGVDIPEGVDKSVLARLSAKDANIVRGIDEGRTNLSSIPMKDRTAYLKLVNEYDPAWDQNLYSLRRRQNDDLSSNGNAGKMLLATNQLLPHLNSLGDRAAKLDNGNYPGGNVVSNWIATQRGDPRVKDFQTIRAAAANDAARLLRGTGAMAEKDIEEWRNNFNEAGSPAQLQTTIASLADDLIGARVSSIQHSYRMNMRKEPPEMVSKEAQAASAAIKERAQKANEAYSGKPAATAPAAAAAPTAAAPAAAPAAAKPPTVTQNGHVYVLQPDGSYK